MEVRDDSMQPTLRPGDRLLVDPRAYRDQVPQPGDLVVVVDPGEPSRWLVKRVIAVGPGRWRGTDPRAPPGGVGPSPAGSFEPVDLATGAVWVQGDSPETSRDSRRFGAVAPAGIVGRAYRCYHPRDRRRDL